MPTVRTYKQSDLEKRLKLLKTQLYGKPEKPVYQHPQSTISPNLIQSSDTTFLKQDLVKIAILASLAIGVQLLLYFSQLQSKIKLF